MMKVEYGGSRRGWKRAVALAAAANAVFLAGLYDPATGAAAAVGSPVVFYVAPNGRDAWSGTLARPNAAGTDGPLATLARARDAIRQFKSQSGGRIPATVTVLVRGGKYFLREPLILTSEDSGSQESPVVYAAYRGEKPVLSGGRRVSGWHPYKGKILQASVPEGAGGKWRFRELFYNGKRQPRASTPDFDPQNPRGGWARMEGPAQPGSQIAFNYKAGAFPRHWARPTEAEANVFFNTTGDGTNNIIPIKSIDEQNRVISLAHSTTTFVKPFYIFDCPTPFGTGRFRIENVLEELDQPGEWCWDSAEGRLYFRPPDDAIAKSETVAPVLNDLIVLRGASYVHISGLTLTETNGGDNFHPEGMDGVGCMFGMPGWKYCGDAVRLEGTERCRIEDNRFVNIGGNAVYLKGPCVRNLIHANEIGHAGACGVCLAGKRGEIGKEQYPAFNEVVQNRIHQTGMMNFYSAGIFLGLSEGNVIGHNSIRCVPHHAINLGSTGRSHNIVEYNEIRDTCLEIADTGAINCWMEAETRDEPRQGHVIRYNLIVNSRERGIYLDNYTSNCFVYGNVIVPPLTNGIMVHSGKNNVIENNIIVGSKRAVVCYDGIDGYVPAMALFSSGNRFCRNIICDGKEAIWLYHKRPDRAFSQLDYNLIFNVVNAETHLKTRQTKGYEMHSLIADPLFVAPQHDDFRLKPDSPAFKLGFQAIDMNKIGPTAEEATEGEQ